MATIQTNRDLYLAVAALASTHQAAERALEDYLRALLALAEQHSSQKVLSLGEFYDLLAGAFTAGDPAFDERWRKDHDFHENEASGYPGWRSTLVGQIVDLREMDEDDTLRNEYRYFGVNAPRGSPWYNFDPLTYIECGLAGAFGGWEPADSGGRQLVPGEVAVIGPEGEIETRDPADIESSVFSMPDIDWNDCLRFIQCGQWYE
jgi:hypothetical protein